MRGKEQRDAARGVFLVSSESINQVMYDWIGRIVHASRMQLASWGPADGQLQSKISHVLMCGHSPLPRFGHAPLRRNAVKPRPALINSLA